MFNTIKRHYDAGRYTKDQVKVFVQANWITPAEYELITGEPYVAPENDPANETQV